MTACDPGVREPQTRLKSRGPFAAKSAVAFLGTPMHLTLIDFLTQYLAEELSLHNLQYSWLLWLGRAIESRQPRTWHVALRVYVLLLALQARLITEEDFRKEIMEVIFPFDTPCA